MTVSHATAACGIAATSQLSTIVIAAVVTR
jgi:hypothetical protein